MTEVWEVFLQKTSADPYVHVGSVLAPDEQMAIVYAKECFFRRREGTALWVVPRRHVHRPDDPSILEQVTDKSYRYAETYRDVVKKREVAHAKFSRSAPKTDTAVAGDEY